MSRTTITMYRYINDFLGENILSFFSASLSPCDGTIKSRWFTCIDPIPFVSAFNVIETWTDITNCIEEQCWHILSSTEMTHKNAVYFWMLTATHFQSVDWCDNRHSMKYRHRSRIQKCQHRIRMLQMLSVQVSQFNVYRKMSFILLFSFYMDGFTKKDWPHSYNNNNHKQFIKKKNLLLGARNILCWIIENIW